MSLFIEPNGPERDFRVSVYTVIDKNPFYFYFDDPALALAFVKDIRKNGLKVGVAHFLPRSFTGIVFEGLHGVTVSPQPAIGFSRGKE